MSSLGGPSIVTDGLVLYLDAANTKSYPGTGITWSDRSISSNTGTLVNGPTYNLLNSGSILFDGSNDYCSLANICIPSTTDWTISIFFNMSSFVINSAIFSQYTPVAGNGRFYIGFSNSTALSLFLGNSSSPAYTSTNILSTLVPIVGTTYNFTVSRNNQTYRLYVNGVLNTTSTLGFTASLQQTTPQIGGVTGTGFFNGRVYNTSIYNRSLTETEVLQNFNATRTRFGL